MADEVTAELREKIRRGEIVCNCWDRGTRPGFRFAGQDLVYDGRAEQAHFGGCPWVAAVHRVYELERRLG